MLINVKLMLFTEDTIIEQELSSESHLIIPNWFHLTSSK